MPRGQHIIDMTGQVFGTLTVLSRAHEAKSGTYWLCQCECGAMKNIRGGHLRDGLIRSCGCKSKALAAAASAAKPPSVVSHPLGNRWRSMVQRCYLPSNTSYPRYGAKGIRVCDRWRFGENGLDGFRCFLQDMGELPFEGATIDRIDSTKDYEPGNCRWASYVDQRRNVAGNALDAKTVAEIKHRLLNGQSIRELATLYGVEYSTLHKVKIGKTWVDVQPFEAPEPQR